MLLPNWGIDPSTILILTVLDADLYKLLVVAKDRASVDASRFDSRSKVVYAQVFCLPGGDDRVV